MNSIEIVIDNKTLKTEIYIDNVKQTIIINNKEKEISKEKIEDLIRIIRTWKNNYHNQNVVDAESFFIKINLNSETEIIKGNGSYPENYILFKEWISDFNE